MDVPVPEFVSLQTLSRLTGQSVSTLKGHALHGLIPALKIGALWRIPVSYLHQLEHDAYARVDGGAA